MRLFWWFFLSWLLQTIVIIVYGLLRQGSFSLLFEIVGIHFVIMAGLFTVFSLVFRDTKNKMPWLIQEFGEKVVSWKNLLKESLRTQANLQKELEKWHEIIEALPFPVILIDIHGKILFANLVFQKNFEAKAFCWEIPSYPLMQTIEKLLQEGGGESEPIAIREKYYTVFIAPLIENRFLVMFINKTEEMQREKREREFITYAAHELKTPLTAIQGYLEIMEPTVTNEQKHSFDVIAQHVKRLIRLSQDILSLHRFELAPLSIEKFDIIETVHRVYTLFGPSFKEKGLRFEIKFDTKPLMIEGDSLAIEEILVNLVENALRYTEKGEVILSVWQKDETIHIHCQDSGIGIGEKDLPHIFDRFYVVDKSRSKKTGGTGLGLAIVKSLVLRHKGKVYVQSEKGKGSTFIVELPVEQTEKHV